MIHPQTFIKSVLVSLFVLSLSFLSSCSGQQDNDQATSTVPITDDVPTLSTANQLASDTTALSAQATEVVIVPTATATATPVLWRIQVDGPIPADLVQAIDQLPAGRFTAAVNEADIALNLTAGEPIAEFVYAAVAPFSTIRDDIGEAELQQATLFGTAETVDLWKHLYPEIQVVPEETLVETVWANQGAYAIVPFDKLTPDLKAMRLDGQSPLSRDLDLDRYPLNITVYAAENQTAVADLVEALGPITNRDEEKMTRIAMTGVTALVRATAAQMEYSGILFPGEVVAPILQSADVAHISNEVPFAENCPFPNAISQSVVFCSRDSYFQLLEHLGADIIEVTGNHSNDYGTDAMLRSLEKYVDAGMNYYGGGRDLNDSFQPAYVYDHDNKIAFIGCNSFGPGFAWATADQPGTAPCGDLSEMTEQIETLAAEGYVVIATFQYEEIYSYQATASQVQDFGALAKAGASAVSGSQSHHPQAFSFENGAFIHYGLGNLFFDQMNSLGTRQMFIDSYLVYDGRLISVELWTGLIEYYSRPREMTPAERESLLNSVFRASGW